MDQPDTTKRTLPCALTDDDRLRIGSNLSEAVGQETVLEHELRDYKEDHKSRLLPVQSLISRLAGYIRDDSEPREIECAIVRDVRLCQIRVVRSDTNEVVEERAMTEFERQMTIADKLSPGQGPADLPEKPGKPGRRNA